MTHDGLVRAGPAGSSPMWCMSRKNYRFVRDTRFCTDVGSAVRPRHAGDSWFDRARHGPSNQLSATSWLHRHEPGEVQNHQHSGIRRASARRAKRRWSDSSLQVEDPKASGTPTSLAVTFATFSGSATIAVAHFIMHHDMSRRRIDALRLGCCSEPHP